MFRSKNINIIAASHFITGFLFFVPIIALYLAEELGSVTKVGIYLAIVAVGSALLEIPTGAFADIYGRKTSLLTGHFLFILALVFLALGGFYIYIAAIILAVSSALISGCDVSIIYDTLISENRENEYKKVMSKLYALWPMAAIAGSIAGGYFASYSLRLPIVLSFIPLLSSFFFLVFLEEPPIVKKSMVKQISASVKSLLENKQLLLLMGAGMIFMMFGESSHQLKPIYFSFKEIPVLYFGIIFALTFALSALGSLFAHSISERLGNKNTLILVGFMFPLFLFLSTSYTYILSIILIILTSVPFGVRNPLLEDMMQKHIASSQRATVSSINSFLISMGIGIGTLMLGFLTDVWNINVVFRIAAFCMVLGVILLFFVKE